MTIEEAAENIGQLVVYERPYTKPETGRIESVRGNTVFVLYNGDLHPKGTNPEDLTAIGAANRQRGSW